MKDLEKAAEEPRQPAIKDAVPTTAAGCPTPISSSDASNDDARKPTIRLPLWQVRLILGFSAITSGLTATIYFPLLPLLREQFHASAQAINLTLTVYVVFQAISPITGPTLGPRFRIILIGPSIFPLSLASEMSTTTP